MSESRKSWSDLTPEQIEKLKTCGTPEELLALAKEEGIELSYEQLEQVSGGDIGSLLRNLSGGEDPRCPKCGGTRFLISKFTFECENCHFVLSRAGQ